MESHLCVVQIRISLKIFEELKKDIVARGPRIILSVPLLHSAAHARPCCATRAAHVISSSPFPPPSAIRLPLPSSPFSWPQ
jgi:hypothetical protein